MSEAQIPMGPLEPLLADPAITSITIDRQAVRYTRNGLTQISEITFESDAQCWELIDSILAACGETLSAEHHTLDCTLADGTRVRATHVPLLLSLEKHGSEQRV
jgi:pilus assembly protein CpaF